QRDREVLLYFALEYRVLALLRRSDARLDIFEYFEDADQPILAGDPAAQAGQQLMGEQAVRRAGQHPRIFGVARGGQDHAALAGLELIVVAFGKAGLDRRRERILGLADP